VERQFFMVQYHSRALGARVNPATLFLPMLAKPMVYWSERSGDLVRGVLVFGNPFSWWTAFAALILVGRRWVGVRQMEQPEGTMISGFLVNYAVWLLMTWARPQVMLHYFTPVLPFGSLMGGYLIAKTSPRIRPIAATCLLGMAGLVFVLYYPAITAIPISTHAMETYTKIAYLITGQVY
jgi:dolichyl-phosphate-mannose--protein O-mannosyl transferase